MLKDDDEVDGDVGQESTQGGGSASLASTFRGRNTAKSAEELKKARETRAAEALRMKDEQLKILSEQNATLLSTLDRVSLPYRPYFSLF
jgi:myosin protein heavy chain